MKTRRHRGSALAVLLLVLAVLMVFLVAVVALGARHSRMVQANEASVAAVQAAESAIHTGLLRLSADPLWSAGLAEVLMGGSLDQRYTLQIVNNSTSFDSIPGPGGVTVPAGMIYLLGTGTSQQRQFSRQVAVFLSPAASFNYAIASGGPVDLGAAGTVQGNVKSNGDLVVSARTEVIPMSGEGRVLCGGDLAVQAQLQMSDDTMAQKDVRARGSISGSDKVVNASEIVPNDTSTATLPFVMDGSTTSDPSSAQEVLPNPDPATLLAGAVTHTESVYGGPGNPKTLDLGGQVHFFPNGLHMAGGSQLVGTGTIVVGNDPSTTGTSKEKAIFDIPLDHTMNVLVLDGNSGLSGGGDIQFNGATRLRGMVFCHGNITTGADCRIQGRVIAYGDGSIVGAGPHLEVLMSPAALTCPGFEGFFGSASGPLGMGVVSWQRL